MITFEITETVSFDDEKEEARIKSAFNKAWQKRLMKILNAFRAGEYEKAYLLYSELPYSSKDGCPGQEFVSIFFSYNIGAICEGERLKYKRI